MTWNYDHAGPGNVSLLGEIELRNAVLALGFGSGQEAAATLAISALLQPFEAVWYQHVHSWETWHAQNVDSGQCGAEFRDAIHVSAMVLRTHNDRTFPGAMVASLSIPWGNTTGDIGGYHLVWPRDLVESAGALLAMGALEAARNVLRYLIATQLADGRWSQNQWLDGEPHWTGVQLDEAAFPVLLASKLAQREELAGIAVTTMARRALAFIALHGPATDQDRWEETPGVNAFTLAASIAALVCGAELIGGDTRDILQLADDWNARIEDWCTGYDRSLASRFGVGRYYLRAVSPRIFQDADASHDLVPVRNQQGDVHVPADTLIATDFLQLVRFGLRRADDPVVTATLTLVDGMLRTETPMGPCWHRYNGDGYGEHDDGQAFNGTGHGRLWPLLSGERGHYELAAGRDAEAQSMLRAMMAMSGRGGLIPEQVWDAAPIPEKDLSPGRPSGSAMPLVWAHAEFIKLAVSLRLGHPADRPELVWLRYGGKRPASVRAHWSRRAPIGWIRAGQSLRLIFDAPTLVHWSVDDWEHPQDTLTAQGMLGLHIADVPTDRLTPEQCVLFAAKDLRSGAWSERNHVVAIVVDETTNSEQPAMPPPVATTTAVLAAVDA